MKSQYLTENPPKEIKEHEGTGQSKLFNPADAWKLKRLIFLATLVQRKWNIP